MCEIFRINKFIQPESRLVAFEGLGRGMGGWIEEDYELTDNGYVVSFEGGKIF